METFAPTQRVDAANDSLAGGGEMGARMRALDWSLTPLGSAESWPQSLKTSVSICLNSSFALLVWWGKELVMLYNDAYCPVVGIKHPRALGQTGRACWPEIWDIIGPMLHGVLETGKATRSDDLFLPLERQGYPEECYFTFSYSPIRDESGGVGGVFTPVQETTEKVVGERRLRTLRDLAAQSMQKKEAEEVCRITAATLALNPFDIPFACIYLLDHNRSEAHLAGTAGIEAGTPVSPVQVQWDNADNASFLLLLQQTARTGRETAVEELSLQFPGLPTGAWSHPPETLLLLPITVPDSLLPIAILVAAVSPMKVLDSDYQGFFKLVVGQVAAAMGAARAYEKERTRAEALMELDLAKTTFFSNVSHEFRTPLTLILGRIEDVLAKPEEGSLRENREALTTVHRNGLRLLKLVNTLLDFSRIEAGRVQAVYEPTDLSAYTAEMASMFRSAIEKAGMQLIVNCPPLCEPVYADREMWEKIVLNLLSNAFKFTEAGEIEVSIQEQNGSVELRIRDTGTGIAEAQLPHIFERFHRVEGVRARTQEGTGIGLALVQELAKLQGGNVRVESAYGQGSVFTVSLPLGTDHIPPAKLKREGKTSSTALAARPYVEEALRWLPREEQSTSPDSPSPLETREPEKAPDAGHAAVRRNCIVLADDNADMRDYVCGLLRNDYEVIVVSDGSQALKAVRKYHPDLLLSDVMMPGLNGFELLRALRTDPQTKTIPVILLSARAGEEAEVEGLAAGADDYLIKPFSAKELRARVASHLSMAQLRREGAELKERFLAEMREERTRLTSLFMQTPAFMAVLNGSQHVYERVNIAYDQMIGHRNIIGKTVLGALPEIEGQGFLELLDTVYQTGKPFEGKDMRLLLQLEPGTPTEERFLDFVYQPLAEADGTVSGILVHGVDLTERHRAESALQASNEMLALAIDGADIGTFYCDIPLNEIVCNDRCKEHFFLPTDAEVDFTLFYGLLHPEDRETVRHAIERSLHERVQCNVEYRVVSSEGRMRWINAVGRGYYEDDNKPSRFVGITIDITERMEREAQIRALNAKLRRAMTETHHRVKNNLQMISALIDMQTHSGRETVPISDLTRLGHNIQALGVIHDILTREAKEDGEADFISVKGVLEEFLPILRATMGARQLLAHIDEVSLPGRQTTALALITNELISNAVKHGTGDIEIRLYVEGDRVRLEVCDDGPGFPDDFDAETAANTGLELIENISRYDLGGTAVYENRKQGGGRVVIVFPLRPQVQPGG